jgi:hypothetical protein
LAVDRQKDEGADVSKKTMQVGLMAHLLLALSGMRHIGYNLGQTTEPDEPWRRKKWQKGPSGKPDGPVLKTIRTVVGLVILAALVLLLATSMRQVTTSLLEGR